MDKLDALQNALPSPTTIHALPPELLADILSHLYTADEVHLDSLKAASLVAHAWTDSAQRLLWSAGAELQSEQDIDKFVKTAPLRRSGPKELAVLDYKDKRSLKRLFRVCRGLRWLMLATPKRELDSKVLQMAELSELRNLIVQAWLLPLLRPNLVFPFALHSLVIDDLSFRSPHLAPFLTALSHSSIPSLRSIALTGFSPSAHPAVADALLPFAPHLRHFGLSTTLKADSSPYVPFFQAATSLNSFECTSLPPVLLANLPPSLTVLATAEDACNLDALQLGQAFEGLKGLKRLYFRMSREAFSMKLYGGRRLLEETITNGVDWRFEGDEV
ncbi:hypothetical protein JCM11641_002002 [Rhodosporidiobolus odoratus]